MIVPISQGFANVSSAMPSETNMLMALAEMHKQGRIPQPYSDSTPSMPKTRGLREVLKES